MKKLILLAACLATFCASAQQTEKRVPLKVVVPEQAELVPLIAQSALMNKMRQVVNLNGVGATDDGGQFYMTCIFNVTDKQLVGGAPAKIVQKIDATFYVVDGFGQKIFGTTALALRGVGDNENKALIHAMKGIAPNNQAFKSLITTANGKIIAYYEEQCDHILAKANTLALAKEYEAAFFQLSLIPEACACYDKVLTAANTLFHKYIDDQANANLAKARSIWNAGQDRDAASEAGEYLAQILPDAKCYPQALELAKEIKTRVKSDIDFDRKMLEWKQKNTSDLIKGWRDIGVAYGNNQKAVTYNPTWLLR